jgi:DNA-binding XRE family transcriptional regulator
MLEKAPMLSSKVVELLIESRRGLFLSQGALGELLGASRRTSQRWERGHARPSPEQLAALAKHVHGHDPSLAARLAEAAQTSLVALGLVAPPPAPPAPPPVAPAVTLPAPEHIIDAVVCAAADAIDVMPSALRPALHAAFRRARLVGLDVATAERALDASLKAAAAPSAPGASNAPRRR